MRARRLLALETAAVLVLVAAGVAALVWITVFGDSEHGGEEQEQAAERPTPVAVTIQDFLYKPPFPGITPGSTVTWTQRDVIAHTVTSGKRGEASAGSVFDRTLSNVGETFAFDFQQVGVFDYFCRFHPQMLGTVNVADAATLAAERANPTPQPSATPRPFTSIPAAAVRPPPSGATLVAGDLQNPRGFTWGPDGAIYVAEVGTPDPLNLPGTESVESRATLLFCEGWNQQRAGEEPPPDCPQQPAQRLRTGRISRIAADGRQHVVVAGLPVIAGMFGFTEGPASVAFLGNDLYVLIVAEDIQGTQNLFSGAFPTGVYKVAPDGSGSLVANIFEFNFNDPPVAIPPDWGRGEPYDMIARDGKLYVSDGNASVVFEVDPNASGPRIRLLADLSAYDGGHPVLTGLAPGPDGNIYVTNLTKAPYAVGGAKVWRITPAGQITEAASGFTLGVGLAMASDGTLYVAEFARIAADQNPPIVPGGRLLRARPGAQPATILENLFYPTTIRWGPDNQLYVTYFSIGADNGTAPGALYRIDPATR